MNKKVYVAMSAGFDRVKKGSGKNLDRPDITPVECKKNFMELL